MNTRCHSPNPRLIMLCLALGLALTLTSTGLATAEEPGSPDRSARLSEAATRLWLDGPTPALRQALTDLAAGPADAVTGRALFHLTCLELLDGRRDEALAGLARLEALGAAAGEGWETGRLRRLLQPGATASQTTSINVHEVAIPQVIRMAAESVGRAVIIDGAVENRMISLHLPVIEFDRLLEILSGLGNFSYTTVGDVILVTTLRPELVEGGKFAADGLLSLNFQQVNLADALRLIATKGGLNLVIHKNVHGTTTINIDGVTASEALRLVARACDLHIEPDGNCLLVMNKQDADRVAGRSSFEVVHLQFLKAADALQILARSKLAPGRVVKGSNAVTLSGDPDLVERSRLTLLEADRPPKPLRIDTRIWEWTASAPYDSAAFQKMAEPERAAVARLLSAPRIITLPGRLAEISIEDARKTPSESGKEEGSKGAAGIRLAMNPLMLPDGLVQLDLKGKIEGKTVDATGKVHDQKREIQTTMVVRPGVTFLQEVQGGGAPVILEITINLVAGQ